MLSTVKNPCDELIIAQAGEETCAEKAKPWVLIGSIAGSSMAFINGSVVNVALPAIQQVFAGSLSDVQWIVNSYTVVLAALILVGGSMGDRYGRRKLFLSGIIVFLIASVWCGLSPNILHLILARALQGVGGALLIPNSLALVSSAFPQKERGKAIGTWSAFSAITTAIGPMLGGWLVDEFSWRPIFFLNIPIALVALIITVWRVPEFKDEEHSGHLDWGGALLAVVGMAALSMALIQATEWGFSHPYIIAGLVLGVLCFMGFIGYERIAKDPMMPLSIFNSRSFSGINTVTLLIYFALSGMFFFLPFNLIQIQGYTATQAGAAFLPFTLLVGFLSRFTGALVDRIGGSRLLILGTLLNGVGYVLLGVLGDQSGYWIAFFPGLFTIGLGMAVIVSPLTTIVMNSVSDAQTGTASGINNTVSRMSGMLAIAVLGIVAVQIFSVQLSDSFQSLSMPIAIQEQLQGEATKMAGLIPPEGIDQTLKDQITGSVQSSFLYTFRWMMWISAGTAGLATLFLVGFSRGEQKEAGG
ncbi:MAG: MFS transporter [Bacteroidota bacterium]